MNPEDTDHLQHLINLDVDQPRAEQTYPRCVYDSAVASAARREEISGRCPADYFNYIGSKIDPDNAAPVPRNTLMLAAWDCRHSKLSTRSMMELWRAWRRLS